MVTSLTPGATETDSSISSLMDTWIVLSNRNVDGMYRRTLGVLKSRGMAHSNELREFVLTDHGVDMRGAAGGTLDDIRPPSREGRDSHAVI